MRQFILSILVSMLFFYGASQPKNYADCETLEDDNRYLWFNDGYETIVENGLRCFRLNSVGTLNDSCIRIWIYESDYPDTPIIFRIKLFEMGVNKKENYAIYYTLEWEGGHSPRMVKCIKKKSVKPVSGWEATIKKLQKSKLDKIYTIPYKDLVGSSNVDMGMLLLQYINQRNTITLDFTTRENFTNSRYEGERRFSQLLSLIRDEFLIDLYADEKAENSLKKNKIKIDTLIMDIEPPLSPNYKIPSTKNYKNFKGL